MGELEGIEIDRKGLSILLRIFLKVSPRHAFRHLAKRGGVRHSTYEKMHEAFAKTGKVDIFPLSGQGRGFILVLDRNLSFWFYQNGGHFEYDGFEMGEYGKGDVTIFDGNKSKKKK